MTCHFPGVGGGTWASDVLLPVLQMCVRSIFHQLLVIVRREKCLDVNHGLFNVLTKPAGVLQTETDEPGWR